MLSFVNILQLSSYEVGNAWQIGVAQWYNTSSSQQGRGFKSSPVAEKESTTEKEKRVLDFKLLLNSLIRVLQVTSQL